MKLILTLGLSLFLVGCAHNTEYIIQEKIVYVESKPKVIVKKPIPIPTPKPLDVKKNLYCPSMDEYPEAATLTNEQVTETIQRLIDNNNICHYNMEKVKEGIEEYNKRF